MKDIYSYEGDRLYLPLPLGYGFIWEESDRRTVEEITGYVYKGDPAELHFITKSGITPVVSHESIKEVLTPQQINSFMDRPVFYESSAWDKKVCPFYISRMVEEPIPFVITWGGDYQERKVNPKLIKKGFCLKKSDCGDCSCDGDRERCEV